MANVTVKSKFGQFGTIDDKDLSTALTHGFQLASNEEIGEHNAQIEYGSGILNPLAAFAEEAASTATFGGSREAENALGITTPEAQAARAKYNPTAHLAGIPAGLLADPFGAIGLLGKAGGKTVQGAAKAIGVAPEGAGLLARAARNVPTAAAGAAVEGAGFGLGQSVAEHAMGDPDLNAEQIAANVGFGALFGGGLGGALEGTANAFGKTSLKTLAQAKSLQDDIAAGVMARDATAEGQAAAQAAMPPPEVPPGMQTPFQDFPKSIDEIQQAVKTNFPVVPEGVPSHGALKEVVDGLPDLQFKPHALQYESLTDSGKRDFYKTILEGQGEEAKALRDYEALQKSEAQVKLDNTISELAPGTKLHAEPVSAGESAIQAFSKQYEAEKKELAPLFKQFDEVAGNKNMSGIRPLANLQEIFPTVGDYLTADADGVFKLSKYKSSMPFSKNTYGAIKDLVEAANEKSLTLSGLRNVREAMRDRITLTAGPRDQAQIGSIRKMLMDEMEKSVSEAAPSMAVRDTFKRYAQNEEKRAVIESIMGGSISDRASFAKTIKPEEVLNKIFSNTVSVNAAKEILGKDFNKVLADYLAGKKLAVTDDVRNGFSSNKYATFLKGKRPELMEALKDNIPSLKRIGDLTDYMRILPDSPSVNPSGTAKTLGIMEKIAGVSKILKPMNMLEDFAARYGQKAEAAKQRFTLDEVLAGKNLGAAKEAAENNYIASSRIARLGRMAEQTAYAVQQGAKDIFYVGHGLAKKAVGVVGSKLVPSPMFKDEKDKADKGANYSKPKDVFAKIGELQSDPMKMMDELEKMVGDMHHHSPMVAQGVQAMATRGMEFLATKLPPHPPADPFSKDTYAPSKSEIAQFERYFNVVEDPIHAFSQVKNNTITPEVTEALATVYPKLFDQMKMAAINAASDQMKKGKLIPFSTKQSLSIFLGSPVDSLLTPASIQANQQVFAQMPKPGDQAVARPSKTGMDKLTLADRTGLNRGQMEA